MKRVCMMTSVHRHNDVRIYHKEAKALAQGGYAVTIMAPDFAGEDGRGIRFVAVDVPEERRRRILCSNFRMLHTARRLNADIYHIHDPELLPAALSLKKSGKAVVYDAHEDVPKQMLSKDWIPAPLRDTGSGLFGRFEVSAAQRLDLTIGATRSIAGRFDNGIAVHNYPDPSEFSGQERQSDSRQFCYVGALTRNRGVETLARAIGSTSGRLVLAGEFEDAAFQREILGTKPKGKIHYRGYLGRREVTALFPQCAAGLLLLEPTASYRWSMPIKLFEYMLAGLPVIASDFPFWRRLLGEECALFIPPGDPARAAGAMEWILNNPVKAGEMGRHGRRLVQRRFSFEREKERLLEAYSRLSLMNRGRDNR